MSEENKLSKEKVQEIYIKLKNNFELFTSKENIEQLTKTSSDYFTLSCKLESILSKLYIFEKDTDNYNEAKIELNEFEKNSNTAYEETKNKIRYFNKLNKTILNDIDIIVQYKSEGYIDDNQIMNIIETMKKIKPIVLILDQKSGYDENLIKITSMSNDKLKNDNKVNNVR